MKKHLEQYFTTSNRLKKLMSDLLGDTTDTFVLEPSIGRGDLIKDIIGAPKRIDGIDVDNDVLEISKLIDKNMNLYHTDFLKSYLDMSHEILFNEYDCIISNPPYGLDINDLKPNIKKKYKNINTVESYTLFMHFSLSLLKNNGRYVFLVPATFLINKNEHPLRTALIEKYAPTHIYTFPSKYFETINFGYAQLCIIAGNRKPLNDDDDVIIKNVSNDFSIDDTDLFKGSILKKQCKNGWSKYYLINDATVTLSYIADCISGFYTPKIPYCIGHITEENLFFNNSIRISKENIIDATKLSDEEKIFGVADLDKFILYSIQMNIAYLDKYICSWVHLNKELKRLRIRYRRPQCEKSDFINHHSVNGGYAVTEVNYVYGQKYTEV